MSLNATKLLGILIDYARCGEEVPSMKDLQVMMGFCSMAPLQSCLLRLIEHGKLIRLRN